MSLPLVVRKKIRDYEPKLKEHLETIKVAVGKEFEFEADWANAYSQVDGQSSKDNIGEIYQSDAMGYLARNIEGLCKQEMTKEAFSEATSASKIIIRPNDKAKNYWELKFENGALVCEHKKSICNLYEIGNCDLIKVIPTPGLPLATRLNIDKYQSKRDEYLEELNSLTGASDWSLEADFEKLLTQLSEQQKNNIGETYYSDLLGYLLRGLKDALAKETTKESFVEATSQHKIIVSINDKQPSYWGVKFQDGALLLSHKKDICNLYEVGNFRWEDLIPCPGLPLNVRLNIEQYKPQLDEQLERINQYTGESDWTVEIPYDTIVPQLDANQQKNIGETYFECVRYLANNLEARLKSETTKEAFNEATSHHKIVFAVNDKLKGYWELKFKDGAILLSHRKSICNLYEIGNFYIEDLIPSPGGLALVTRLDIEKYQSKLEENLDRIRTVSGENDWVVEVDFEAEVKANPNIAKNAGETFYSDALGYVASGFEEYLKNETIKEAFLEATSQKKIVFVVDTSPKATKYWDLKFENGIVKYIHKKDICNMYEIRNMNIPALLPVPGVMSLLARLNIQSYQTRSQEIIERINKATGEEYSVDDASIETSYKALLNDNAKNNIGETFLSDALNYLANNLEKILADDMTKEAFNEVATAHQIVFRPADPKTAKSYWNISFENGAIVLTFKPDLCNLYEIGNFDIEKLL